MADDNQINQTPSDDSQKNRSEERFTALSEKVKDTAQERDKEKEGRLSAERERDFFSGFSDIVATHPGAKDLKDDIKAKVMSGYTVQDATFAALGAAGKLQGVTPQAPAPQVAGGSAPITSPQETRKEIKDMTLAEKREILAKELLVQ